jgi:hypothetical protein
MRPGMSFKMLPRIDGPVSGHLTVVIEIEVEAGTAVARHTHPAR